MRSRCVSRCISPTPEGHTKRGARGGDGRAGAQHRGHAAESADGPDLFAARPAEDHPDGQQARVHRSGDANLGAPQRVALKQIEPGKPNQTAYVESFNGRLRDECLNEHWFITLAHARVEIERWRREINEEKPKRSLGGLPPAAYVRQIADKALTKAGDTLIPTATQGGGDIGAKRFPSLLALARSAAGWRGVIRNLRITAGAPEPIRQITCFSASAAPWREPPPPIH